MLSSNRSMNLKQETCDCGESTTTKAAWEAWEVFGRRVKKMRLAAGLLQTDFGRIPAAEVSRIERGQTTVGRDTQRALAIAMDMDPKKFYFAAWRSE